MIENNLVKSVTILPVREEGNLDIVVDGMKFLLFFLFPKLYLLQSLMKFSLYFTDCGVLLLN